MPDRFVEHPYHLARHRAAPFLEERRLYLSHVMKEGRAFATLKSITTTLLAITQYLRIEKQPVPLKQIESAADRWLCRQRNGCSPRVQRIERARFIFHARNWLRYLGMLDLTPQQHWFSEELRKFKRFQSDERDLAGATVLRVEKDVTKFLLWVGRRKSLQQITTEDVSRYLQSTDIRSWKRTTIGLHLSSLRVFFRFAESRGWCRAGLANMIDGPRLYRHERLPRGPQWKDVEKLLKASAWNRPTAIRNHVLLSLFAVYGFRSSEVCQLRLDDIDWERETISLIRAKRRERECFPLIQTVGMALAKYLREVRPKVALREVFISRKQPYRPLTNHGIYQMVKTYQRQLGLTLPRFGPHSLRHACATHLLAEGHSLKEIADHLGHTSISSTQIYAKVNLAALREVAEMDLADLICKAELGIGGAQ